MLQLLQGTPTMADKLYYVSSVNVRLKRSEQLMKCIHNSFLKGQYVEMKATS